MQDVVEKNIVKGELNEESVKPILKWVGGKTQLIPEILKRLPRSFNQYIEPFFGGGALFFHLQPKNSIIADINPELINLYKTVRDKPDELIKILKNYRNDEVFFYEIRSWNRDELDDVDQASRTIFLNKTCFNGLYRVNKKGQFNTPFGRYKNPNIVNEKGIYDASKSLQKAVLVNKSYEQVLELYAKPGDFIFLDPPYLPIGKYEDFKRYTKEGFYEEDHIDLAENLKKYTDRGCYVILTNSNSPIVYDLYSDFDISVIQTKRNINSNGNKRQGEDVIVCAPPKKRKAININDNNVPVQCHKYPQTRYMGSKQSLLNQIANAVAPFEFDTVLDLFSGSGVVSYLFKALGKTVIANDYMVMNTTIANALISNSTQKLSNDDIEFLITGDKPLDNFISETFKDIYFKDKDNEFIDLVRGNIKKLKNKSKQQIAMSALIKACIKKRPRGIFTYTGLRYDDGRKDLKMSFEKQFRTAVKGINDAVFENGKECKALNKDSMSLNFCADLVYIDPPYYSEKSDNEYVRRYHFIEGLARDWKGVDMQWHTKTKKFKNYPTPFSTKIGAYDAFDKLFKKHKNSILVVSYSSNSIPTKDEMIGIMAKYKKDVEVISIDYTYSFGNQNHKIGNNNNRVQEYLFIGY